MPDFDKNLDPVYYNKTENTPSLPNPSTPVPNNYVGLGETDNRGRSLGGTKKYVDPIYGEAFRPSEMLPTVTSQQLYENRRYPNFSADTVNPEDQFANAQSGLAKATNGVLKGLNLTATTIAGGFGMLGGAVASPFTGKLSTIWDNPVMNALDDWNNEVDQNYLPNYYTNKETASDWYDTENWMTTNFLFDKLIKNSGYAVGAMLSGNIANGILGATGAAIGGAAARGALLTESSQAFKLFTPLLKNTSRAFSAGKNIEAAGALEQQLSSIADLTTKSSEIAKIAKTTNQIADFSNAARRTAIAAYSSGGEAAFEALQTSKEYRNSLIENYKNLNNGEAPSGEELENINAQVAKIGKTSFLGNLALLSLTEYMQLPKLLGSSYAAEKQAANSLMGKVDDVFLKEGKYAAVGPSTKFGKIYGKATKVGGYFFDPKEGGQEIGQYALQVGVQNYFKKQNDSNNADVLIDGFLYGMYGVDEEGREIGALNSKAGIEGGILGAITGGPMQAFGKSGTIAQDKITRSNTSNFISEINAAPSFKEAFIDKKNYANRSIVLNQQHQAAIIQNDKLEATDIKTDLMFTYLNPRIKYGRFDMVMEDIADLREMGLTEEGLATLKEQGIGNIDDDINSFQKRLNNIETSAKNISEISKALNLRFSGEILKDEEGNPIISSNKQQLRKYSPLVIDKMVYAASKIADYDKRIPVVNISLAEKGINTFEVLQSIIDNNKPNREATDAVLSQINKLDTTSDVKDELKRQLSDVIELSLRRKLFIQEYDDIQKKPLNYETDSEYKQTSEEEDVTIEQKPEGRKRKPVEKQLKLNKEYSLKEALRKEGNSLHLAPKITVLSQTLGGEYEVVLPNGKKTFLTPTEFKQYTIIDGDNSSKELSDILEKSIDTVLHSPEFEKYKEEYSTTTNKLEFINEVDNEALTAAVEKEFNAGAKFLIEKLERETLAKEKLAKEKENLDAQLRKLQLESGDVQTAHTLPTDIIGSEDKRKDVDILFLSGTSPSRKTVGESEYTRPHAVRTRNFLNNFKFFTNRNKIKEIIVTPNNVKELGLEGLIQLSYGKQISDELSSTETNVETGFMGKVFILQTPKGDYFVNEKGEKLNKVGTQSDTILDNVVFQTMTSASLITEGGYSKVRSGQEELAETALEAYKIFRQQVFDQKGYTPYSFTISRGIPTQNIVNGEYENNHIGDILGPNSDKIIEGHNGLITVVTTGKIEHNGELLTFPVGTTLLQYGDLLDFANNKKLTNKQANNVYSVINALANDLVEKSSKNLPVKLEYNYSKFLQNILYWKSKADTSSPSQIGIDTAKMVFKIGNKEFSLFNIEENKQVITDALQDAFLTVNNKTLAKGTSEKFTEYSVNKEGILVPIIWKNYQTYLLSNKYPDGSTRNVEETPLITHTAPATETSQSYEGKYTFINDADILPYDKVPVREIKKETPQQERTIKIGEYELNNNKENVFKVNTGDILFTADINPAGIISVDVKTNKTIEDIATNVEMMSSIEKALKSANIEDIPLDNEGMAKLFVKNRITADLLNKQEQASLNQKVSPIGAPKETLEKNWKKDLEEKTNGLESARKGDEGIYYTTFKGVRQDWEKDQNVKIKAVSANGVLFEGEKDWKNYNDSWHNFKNLTREQEINNEYKQKLESPKEQIESIEKQTSFAPEPKKAFDPSKIKRNDDLAPEFRQTGKDVEDRMSNSDIEIFKEWQQKNVPGIPFEILDRIIQRGDVKAWGVFEDGVAKFVRGGLRGTEYHEVFEGIWSNFLSENERQIILDEFKNKKGEFTDRQSGKKLLYLEATNKEAKERIADDFADFRIGKLPARSLGEAIRNFFKKIMDFFKSFVAKPSLKNELFKAIDKGKFKENVISNNSYAPQYRAVEGLTEKETNEFIQDMVSRIKLNIFKEGRKDLLFNPEKLTGKEIFNTVKEVYITQGKIAALGEERYNELVKKTIQFFNTIGISFNEDEIVSINVENANGKEYARDTFSVDWKKHSTGAIKFLLSTLTERKASNQTNVEKGNKLSPAEVSLSDYGYKILNFNRVFATLLDRLHNTNSQEEFTEKLVHLAKEDSNYLPLFSALGGNLVTHTFDFDSFGENDWRLFIQFFNTFSRQKPDSLIQYTSIDGEVHTGSANIFTTVNQTVENWVSNMKSIGKADGGLINYDKQNKIYKINVKEISTQSIKKGKDMVEFLNKLGIDFPIGTYNALSTKDMIVKGKQTSEMKMFTNAVASIYTQIGKNNNLMTFNGKNLAITGPIRTLSSLYTKINNPNQDSTYFGVEGQRIGSFSENNAPSYFENTFNESKTLEELLEKMPQLNDVYSKGSEILKKGGLFFNEEGKRIAELKVGYIQGSKNEQTGKNKSTAKLALGERYIQEINQNINGNYYILIPGDSSTEWMMNLGNVISMEEVISNTHWSKVFNIYSNYLNDEINLALENRKQNVYQRAHSQELRILKDILPKDIVSEIEAMIKEEYSYSDIQEFIRDNKQTINKSIQDFLESSTQATFDLLVNSNQIQAAKENNYYIPGIDSQFLKEYKLTGELTEQEAKSIISFANINYTINNQEYHKILFGDPYQFKTAKGKLDETKRIKSFLSGRRRTFDSPEYNNFLNKQYNNVNGIELTEGTPGYHEHKSHTNTVTLNDVTVVGSIATQPYVDKSMQKVFASTNETDAMSWLMDNTHREIALKEGQWTKEAEDFHQWQMAYTRNAFDKKGISKYTNQTLKEADSKLLESKMPKHKLAVRKPIISGNKNNQIELNIVLDKTSQMPLYYHMVEGTNLESMYIKMFKENIGYGIVTSGRKVGNEGANNIYNTDGSFNNEPFNNIIQVPWKIYGTQVETMSEGTKTQTRGSQVTKVSNTDLYENGEVIGNTPERKEAIKKANDRHTNALKALNQNAYNELLKSLGIVDLGGSYALASNQKISETLLYEMLRRDLSENAKDTIQLDENGEFLIPFEASPSYTQIKNILYSMVNKALISPSMNGAPHVQVPSTMFEKVTEGRSLAIKTETGWKKISKNQYNKLSEEEKQSVMLTDDTLKFYENEDGKRYCEVLLPHWFKNKFGNRTDEEILNYLNSKEGQKILTGIGFRIPTQALSSMEVFRVKGFLPQYMGYTVVVPSEITTKAGSDFDIDKLNIYLKSIYKDEDGKIKLVQSQGSEEETKEYFSTLWSYTRAQEIQKIKNKGEFTNTLSKLFNVLEETSVPLDKALQSFYDNHINIINDIIDKADEKELLPSEYVSNQMSDLSSTEEELTNILLNNIGKDEFVSSMYKKSLENEYYESLEELLTLPENFNKLISPIDDAGLEKIADLLDEKRGINESGIQGRLINRNYMTNMRHAFITGKRWVGIAAVNITNLSLRQKSKVYLDPVKLPALSSQEKKFVKDLEIILPHNTLTDNNTQYVSLSGNKTADGSQYISDRLSGYATGFVDIANNPFITKIIKSDTVVSTFMFLEAIGAGNTGIYFLNQPIIQKYLEYLDNTGSKSVMNSTNLSYIKNQFPTTEKVLEGASIQVDGLLDNIQEYAKKEEYNDNLKNAEQQLILNEFIKYKILADQLFSYTQSINYDTTRFGNSDILLKKEWATLNTSNFNLISNVDDVLNKTFIGEQADLLSKSFASYGEIMKTEKPEIKAYTIDTLKKYATKKYMSADDYEKIANSIKNSFVDFIIQNNTTFTDIIKSLLVNSATNVVSQLEQAKQKYPLMQILQDLVPVLGNREDSAKSIQLKVNVKDTYSENLYVGMMRELRDSNPELNNLYNNIVNVAILQGNSQSAISLKNIIPVEDYSKKIAPIINNLNVSPSLEAFANGMFERNNFKNPELFVEYTPYAFETENSVINPLTGEDVSVYTFPAFKTIPGVKIGTKKLIALSDKFNNFQISSDFIKIPKIITAKSGAKINIATGLEVSGRDFYEMKQKGNFDLYNNFYYKKVYTKITDSYGNYIPLTTPGTTKQGEPFNNYYYKLINVYGEGNRAVEYNTEFGPSVIDNGSMRIQQELLDKEIVNYFAPNMVIENIVEQISPIQEESISLPIEESIENILTDSGATIASLEMSQEEWDSLTEEEKNQFKKCN